MSDILTFSFCDPYIPCLVEYLDKNYIQTGKDLSRLALVFGGKRPALFVKREIARITKKSIIPPSFFSIDNFMAEVTRRQKPFAVINELEACYLLFELAKQYTPDILHQREKFSEFLPWTRELLHFIDMLDLEYISEQSLQNIEAHAEIGYPIPDDINKLLEHIVCLRRVYHQALEDREEYSRGYQYYKAAQHIASVSFDEFDHFIFCNFFYFNRCEELVTDHLYVQGKASFLFQGDERKWPVLKRWSKKYQVALHEGAQPKQPAFALNVYSGLNSQAQVCLVRQILNKIDCNEQTVIVLPDPNQIVPLLSEISALVQTFNISMGYPLRRSSLYALFEAILQVQLSKRENRYYAKDYLQVLNHPFIKNFDIHGQPEVTRILLDQIEWILTGQEKTAISGTLFVRIEDIEALDSLYTKVMDLIQRAGYQQTRADLEETLRSIHALAFSRWQKMTTMSQFLEALRHFLDVFIHQGFIKTYALNVNVAQKFYSLLDEFTALPFNDEEMTLADIFKIFKSRIENEIIAFKGSPLKGLQVLGLFETRSLNFKNVIVIDVNEGKLPRLSLDEPLIPREVMISLNLDRLELEEEIQRYQFMRLISSADNVYLIFQEGRDKERSRFIEELIWEEQKKTHDKDAVPVTRSAFKVKVIPQEYRVQKTPQMIDFLKAYNYSASSLNMYLRNPMDFYYSHVLGIREKDDLLDEPESRQVGVFLHELLEQVFKPYIGKKPPFNQAFLNHYHKIFTEHFAETFDKSMKADAFLLRSVLQERLKRFLEHEKDHSTRQVKEILCLERKFQDVVALPCGEIKFSYIVDRIDRLTDGSIMIIDYKTGYTAPVSPLKAVELDPELLSRTFLRDQLGSFQLPLYYYFLSQRFPDQALNAALYNIRTLEWHPFLASLDVEPAQIHQAFLVPLNFIMQEIFDPQVDFIHDPLPLRD